MIKQVTVKKQNIQISANLATICLKTSELYIFSYTAKSQSEK